MKTNSGPEKTPQLSALTNNKTHLRVDIRSHVRVRCEQTLQGIQHALDQHHLILAVLQRCLEHIARRRQPLGRVRDRLQIGGRVHVQQLQFDGGGQIRSAAIDGEFLDKFGPGVIKMSQYVFQGINTRKNLLQYRCNVLGLRQVQHNQRPYVV